MNKIRSIHKSKRHINLDGQRGHAIERAHSRIVWMLIIVAFAYVLVAARLFDLSVFQATPAKISQETDLAYEGHTDEKREQKTAIRGQVYDRDGVMLATSLPMSSLYANPKLIVDEAVVSQGLKKIFPELNSSTLEAKLKNKNKAFIWVKRNISPDDKAETLRLGQPGLGFQEEYRRIYPQGTLGGHLLGYTNIDSKGLAGIERSFETALTQGKDVHLTLDVRLQHVLRKELRAAINKFSAKAGAGIVMDVKTGEILAGISLPDFDPHSPGDANRSQIFNRLTLGAYELGSLFKIFSTAALLEHTNLPMKHKFDAREPLKSGGRTINDYHAEKRILSIPEVFIYSSNIGSALMGQRVGTEKLRNFYRDLGLLDPMDIEIKEVARPLVPTPWRDVDTLTASYGHGGTTTITQVAAAVSSIVNGGVIVRPRLIAANADENKEVLRIVSEKTSRKIRQLLRLVVSDGTGSKAKVPGYQVGGKTGTAEKVSPNGGYDRDSLISSFAGIFPAENPRYAVVVMVDEPQGIKESYGYATAGWVAAPVAAEVIRNMASILNIPPAEKAGALAFSAPLKRYISFEERKGRE